MDRKDPTAPWTTRLVPSPHGGDGSIKEECMVAVSLSASARTSASFIGRYSVDGIGESAILQACRGNAWGDEFCV